MRLELSLSGLGIEDLERLEKLLADPAPLLKRIGALIAAESHQAFTAQKFGDDSWAPRYPNQEAPKLNIAGFIQDFKAGRSQPKPTRFHDRPALIDLGMGGGLQGSITFQVTGNTVAIGTNKPYASLHQFGGRSAIAYDEATKDRMKRWLYKPSKMPRKGTVVKVEFRKGREPYAKHVRPLLRKSVHEQAVGRRPFVGIHPRLEKDIVQAVREYIKREGDR